MVGLNDANGISTFSFQIRNAENGSDLGLGLAMADQAQGFRSFCLRQTLRHLHFSRARFSWNFATPSRANSVHD